MRTIRIGVLRMLLGLLAPLPATPAFSQPAAVSEDARVNITQMGLSLVLPEGVSRSVGAGSANESAMILKPADAGWTIRVAEFPNEDRRVSPADFLDQVLESLESQSKLVDAETKKLVGTAVETVERINQMRIAGRPAARIYLERPPLPGTGNTQSRDQSLIYTGITIIQPDPDRFLSFRIDTKRATAAVDIPLYETLVASIEFRDSVDAAEQRRVRVRAGQRFLDLLSEEERESVLSDQSQWFRIFAQGQGGAAQEVGYQRVEIRRGQFGEVDQSTPRERWTREHRQFGTIVSVRARLFQPTRADTEAIFFLSPDREFEAGRVETAVPAGGRTMTVTEDIFRRGDRLTVKSERGTGNEPTFFESTVPPEGYLSRAELYVLPLLVAKASPGDDPASFDLGFYHYDSSQNSVVFRRDEFERPAGSNRWTYRSVRFPGARPTTTELDAKGNILSRDFGDAHKVEPTTPEQLRSLYESKGIEYR